MFFFYVTEVGKQNESSLFILMFSWFVCSNTVTARKSSEHYKGKFRLFESDGKENLGTYSQRD